MMTQAISKLTDWLEEQRISPHAFALQNGLDPSEFSKILRGQRKHLSVSTAIIVEKATKGAVTCEDWVVG